MLIAHLGWLHRSRGQYAQAVALGREALVQAEESDHPWWRSFAAAMLGWTLTETGEIDEASSLLEVGAAFAERDGAEAYHVRCLAHLALARAMAGEAEEAERNLQASERILSYASNPPRSNFLHGAHATIAAARAALIGGSPERAAALAGPVLRAAGSLGWVEPQAEAGVVLSTCRLQSGDPAAAETLAASSIGIADRVGLRRVTWEALAVRAQTLAALGRSEEADAARSASLEAADSVAGALDEPARSGFLGRVRSAIDASGPPAGGGIRSGRR
jgi:tetratricopeptide (TPR) repeat protein